MSQNSDFDGYSAEELRDIGFEIDEHIPDCAIIENHAFNWVEASFEIKGETNDC